MLFSPSVKLVQDLLLAKRELTLSRLIKKLTAFDGIIIDDIGYVQQSKEEMDVLFTLISECYEKTSLLLTSNLAFSQWEKIFKDPMTAAAAIDRLVHYSVVLNVKVPSYRMEQSKEKHAKQGEAE
jgi:DNA replication protein DnaC